MFTSSQNLRSRRRYTSAVFLEPCSTFLYHLSTSLISLNSLEDSYDNTRWLVIGSQALTLYIMLWFRTIKGSNPLGPANHESVKLIQIAGLRGREEIVLASDLNERAWPPEWWSFLWSFLWKNSFGIPSGPSSFQYGTIIFLLTERDFQQFILKFFSWYSIYSQIK